MKANGVVVGLLTLSIGLTGWLIVGSFASYAPTVTATQIQNIMISRTVNLGFAAILLQAGAITVHLLSSR